MPDQPPPGFVSVPAGGARLWVRSGLEPLGPALLSAWTGDAQEWLDGGRERHPVIPLPGGGAAVVRRYLRGGAIRHLNRDLYLGGDRPARELEATEAARLGGVRVPEVLALGRRRAGVGYRAMLATRRILDVRDAAVVLAGASDLDRLALARAIGQQLGAMHSAGVAHPDVNLRNLLVEPNGAVWMIDFDRARLHPGKVPAARRLADVGRMLRSARKLGVPFTAEDLDAMREGYGVGWPGL